MKKKNVRLFNKDYHKTVVANLDRASNLYMEKYASALISNQRSKLEKYIEQLNSCKKTLQNLHLNEDQKLASWHVLADTINTILAYTDSFKYIDPELQATDFWSEWRTLFTQTTEELPTYGKFIVSDKFFQIQSDESYRVRLWKRYRILSAQVKSYRLRSLNWFRSIVHKAPIPKSKLTKIVAVRRFFKLHCELPVSKLIHDTWRKYLQSISKQFDDVNNMTEQLIDKLLLLRDFEAVLKNSKDQDLSHAVNKLDESIHAFHSVIDELPGITTDLMKYFIDEQKKIDQDLIKQWHYTGTALRSNRKLSSKVIKNEWNKLIEFYDNSLNNWRNYFNSKRQSFKKDLALSLLQLKTITMCLESSKTIHEKIHENILPLMMNSKADVANLLDKFKKLDIEKETELKKKIIEENRLTLRKLKKEKLPQTIDSLIEANLMKSLQNFQSRVKYDVDQLSETYSIIERESFQNLKPVFKSVDIPLKTLVYNEVYVRIFNKYDNFMDNFQIKLDTLVRDISEIDQIVEFNLDAAISLLERGGNLADLGEAKNVVIEGLERTNNQFNGLKDQCVALFNLSHEKMIESALEFADDIQELLDNEKIIALQFRVAKARTTNKIKQMSSDGVDFIKNLIPQIVQFIKKYAVKLKKRFNKLRRMTGFMPVREESHQRLTKFLAENRKKMVTLPIIYQRLFRMEAFKDERFFEGREQELEDISDVFETWKNNTHANVTIIGESGSGKTTLLYFAEKKIFKGYSISKIDFENKITDTDQLFTSLNSNMGNDSITSWSDLEEYILNLDKARVVIVENLHNIFIRTINGFDTIERFMLFMTKTYKKIFWVVSCGLYSWNYLDRVLKISKYFTNVCILPEFSAEKIQSIILKRHRVSGYNLQFQEPEDILENRKYTRFKTEEQRQEYLQNGFFEKLYKLSGGNVTIAMLFWMQSIAKVDNDKLIIPPLDEFDVSFIQLKEIEDQFVFTAFLQHEKLTVDEYVRIFNVTIDDCHLVINRLKNSGLIIETQNGFRINYLMQRTIVSTLKKKNILI
ncbi:ATP-binding protein [candidate division KSB1 bacterium]|nr:ATP-binding protein [candidate division KSB1 bacterium]